jgi:hypothetical protein
MVFKWSLSLAWADLVVLTRTGYGKYAEYKEEGRLLGYQAALRMFIDN